MKWPAFDYESLTRPQHVQQRNKEIGGPGLLDKITMWVFCGGGSRYYDWGSYSFVRLENCQYLSTSALGVPISDIVYPVPVYYTLLLHNFQRPADHRALPMWPVRPRTWFV